MKSDVAVTAGVVALLFSLAGQGAEVPTPEELKSNSEFEVLVREGVVELDPASGQYFINDRILQILRDEGRLSPTLVRDSDICGKIDG